MSMTSHLCFVNNIVALALDKSPLLCQQINTGLYVYEMLQALICQHPT